MCGNLSNAKQFLKCNAQNAFFIGIKEKVHCTCGHLLVESESNQKFTQWRLDALSIPNYVIKKVRPHGARHGKTEAQNEHFIAHNARKRCVKKGLKGIHDRFQKDLRYRDAQLKADRTAEKCIEMDELALKDFTYRPSPEEFERDKKTWSVSLNTSGRNAPMKLRSDFSEALTKMHRPHRESGEERLAPIPFYQYQKWHSSSSSSSTSWWQWNHRRWSS